MSADCCESQQALIAPLYSLFEFELIVMDPTSVLEARTERQIAFPYRL